MIPEAILDSIREELLRVGVTDLGPDDTVCLYEEDDQHIRLADDGGSWVGTTYDAYVKLEALPDNAGWEAFWQAFNDGEV